MATYGLDYDERKNCRNCGWALLFIAHIVTMVVIGVVYIGMWEDRGMLSSTTTISMTSEVLSMLAISAGVAVVVAIYRLAMVRRSDGERIANARSFNMFIFLVAAIVFGILIGIAPAVVFAVLLVLTPIFSTGKENAAIAEGILDASVKGLEEADGITASGIITSIISAAYMVFWSYAANAIISVHEYDNYPSAGHTVMSGFLWFLLLLSLYWTINVIFYIQFTASAAVVSKWWLKPHAESCTCGAFANASILWLGTAAYGVAIRAGSLLMMFTIFCAATQEDDEISGAPKTCVEDISKFRLKCRDYVHARVALADENFKTAADKVFQLFTEKKFWTIIRHNNTGLVFFPSRIIGGTINAFVVGLPFFLNFNDDDQYEGNAYMVFILCFLMGYFVTDVMFAQLDGAATATYVLWADKPAEMRTNHSGYFSDITTAFEKHPPKDNKTVKTGWFTADEEFDTSGMPYITDEDVKEAHKKKIEEQKALDAKNGKNSGMCSQQ